MPFAATFEISWRMFVVTKMTPAGATHPLQGFALAGAIGADDLTYYLVVDQHGGIPPQWVAETDVIRAEVRKETA
jgi:hypothetical protein